MGVCWCLLVGSALAENLLNPLRPGPAPTPPSKGWSAEADVLGGADVWAGGPGGVGELDLGAGVHAPLGTGGWTAAYLGSLEAYTFGQALYDAHALELGATLRPTQGLGLVAGLRGAAFAPAPWWETALAARYRLVHGAVSGDLRLGAARRAGGGDAAFGGLATLLASVTLAPPVTLSATADLRLWPVAAPSPVTLDTSASLRWTPAPTVGLTALAGAWVLGAGSETPWAGLPPPGTVIGSASLGADWQVLRRLTLVVDLEGERATGSASWYRVGARVGVRVAAHHVAPARPTPVGPVVFHLAAPAATRVEVMGTFDGWAPLPMAQSTAGEWQLAVPVAPGVWEYVYLVDGIVVVPPEATQTRDDGFAGRNGVILVGGGSEGAPP